MIGLVQCASTEVKGTPSPATSSETTSPAATSSAEEEPVIVPPAPAPTFEPAPIPEPAPQPAPDYSNNDDSNSDDSGGSAYYANCTAARAAGAAPLYAGEPGYSSKLDRDGDGVACE
jgi:hypothetical protein